jgi:post-GPI attachment to proteins factor 2
MITSLTYMAVSLRLVKVTMPQGPVTEQDKRSLYYKNLFFILSIASTVGLVVFFVKHRYFCHDLAFSWFAFCEYLIAFSNMGFHYTTTMVDFPQHLKLLVKNVDGNLTVENDDKEIHRKKE